MNVIQSLFKKNIFYFVLGTFKVKAGMAQMAKGGIIMDVTNADEARIAEEAGVILFVCVCVQHMCTQLYF